MYATMLVVPGSSYVDIMSGLGTLEGSYEVTVHGLGSQVGLISDTSMTDGFHAGGAVVKFTWGAQPLYAKNLTGGAYPIWVLISPVSSVANVNLSLGSCS